ncbi:hypothetical protein [Acidihalobacter ferrooxydans]|uniref:Bacterial Ig-like domain-containing protein n=1 Tax=Acidihalobacter ferrooxydans TaxID=1765967 RepID=A0A1P8UDJ6_9GAMM|nr:hypothetical protein [Acidihalobacter ferrooxydans]APZ41922.1 hypothetical protein BW247_01440 [Acidihalobacter ferrooxydans]
MHKVDLPPLITVPVPKQQKVPTTPLAAARQSPGMQAEHLKIQILSPQDKQAIRANNGHVTVHLAIRPALAQGQTIRLYVDGQSAYAGHSLTIGLPNLDRGAHHAYAQVVSPGGDVLARSDTVTFYVLRHSILFKKPTVPAS